MSRAGLHKSVRMFRKFSEETLRRGGQNELGREGIAALNAIEAVLAGQRLFDGSLLEPLAAFTNLLQSAQLPPEFGDYSFGDGLLAIEEAHAEIREEAPQVWEFSPEMADPPATLLADFAPRTNEASADQEHTSKLRACVLEAASKAKPGCALVTLALACPELPLSELAARFERLTLSDLDLPALEAHVRRAVPEQLRSRIKLERYDLTGSYVEFTERAVDAVQAATQASDAEQALAAVLSSYDVGAGSAGLSAAEGDVDLAISTLGLSELGRGYARCIARLLSSRGWNASCVERAPLEPALQLLSRLVEQHHIHALLRRAKASLLVSEVSEVAVSEAGRPSGTPFDLLGVQRLTERLPQLALLEQERSWEWRRSPGSVRLVEAVTMTKAGKGS